MVAGQDEADCFYGIADLHALTVQHDPVGLHCWLVRGQASAAAYLGWPTRRSSCRAGCPPTAKLAYLLECGPHRELNRMIQFKEKGAGTSRPAGSRSTRTRR